MKIYLVEAENIINGKYSVFKSAHHSKAKAKKALDIVTSFNDDVDIEILRAEITELTLR